MAFNRFGLGAKPGDLALAAHDPRGFLLEELRTPGVALFEHQELAATPAALQQYFLDLLRRSKERERAISVKSPPQMNNEANQITKVKPPGSNVEQKLFREEAMARFMKQANAPIGFVERLVCFWSNHFAVSTAKSAFVLSCAGSFEREAIRPHVLGKFSSMLQAVESHPAMIYFLDNQRSKGPGSLAGRLAGRGLNENLAREVLELHTLGVDGGYTQADVTSLARILTGWSFAEGESENDEPGAFVFKANWHEPGAHRMLGKVYPQIGRAQGEAALADLARHPSTARHVAAKLARHFVADEPPEDFVGALAETFLETEGDLGALSAALVADDRAWKFPATKIRTPNEFILALVRATRFRPSDPGLFLDLCNKLGMPLWQPNGPDGFSDETAVWASPQAIKMRLDVSWLIAQHAREAGEPLDVLHTVSGFTASHETREAVARAESRQQALAILFMSPEVQRR